MATRPLLIDIGARIRDAREARGWSQRDLAERCELAQAQIWEIEQGARDMRISTFCKIRDALELPASDLVDDVRH